MKVLQIEYQKLVSGPGFNHEKLGIIVSVEIGDNPDDVFERAKNWVERELKKIGPLEQVPF